MVRRFSLRLLLVALAGLLLFEASVRVLLFSDAAAGLPLAHELRNADRLAHANVEDLYWLLQARFLGTSPSVPGDFDPHLGWVGALVSPGDYRHSEAEGLGGRRPVLLYGDSFARCTTPSGACFEDLLQAGDLGPTHKLLNYGVSGYGLDQITALVEATAEHHRDRKPVIAVGVFVDDDLDRCALSMRGYPKPRWTEDGEFAPVEFELGDLPWFESYGLRLLLHGKWMAHSRAHDLLCPRGRLEALNRTRCERVIERLARSLEGSGSEAFVLLFNGRESTVRPAVSGWREPFLRERLDELGIPWVAVRGPLLAHARQCGRPISDYFQRDGHMNALGNFAAFRALRDGLAGRFGEHADHEFSALELQGPLLTPDNISQVVLGGPQSAARYELNSRPPFRAADERSRLVFRQVGKTPSEIHYRLAGRVTRFTATAKFVPMGKLGPGQGSVGLTLLADGEPLFHEVLRRGDEERSIELDLSGREDFTVRVDGAGDGRRGDWLMLASPAFR